MKSIPCLHVNLGSPTDSFVENNLDAQEFGFFWRSVIHCSGNACKYGCADWLVQGKFKVILTSRNSALWWNVIRCLWIWAFGIAGWVARRKIILTSRNPALWWKVIRCLSQCEHHGVTDWLTQRKFSVILTSKNPAFRWKFKRNPLPVTVSVNINDSWDRRLTRSKKKILAPRNLALWWKFKRNP